jgi:hypothetical protein
VKEQVFISANINKSKSLVGEPLDSTFSHNRILKSCSQRRLIRCVQTDPLRADNLSQKQNLPVTLARLNEDKAKNSQCFSAMAHKNA